VLDDLIRRRVAVIALPAATSIAITAKAKTATIPIVFGVGEDPVRLGLVASLNRPGGNATGFNYFNREVDAKRLSLLHELVPKAIRVAVLLNPSVPRSLREVQEAARAIGLQLHMLPASTSREIDAAFATFERERPDALFVEGDALFTSRRIQLANLAARDRIPTAYAAREHVAAGGLMSYGTNLADAFHHGVKSSKAPSLPTCRWCRRASSSSSSTCRRPG
jgi:putative ABC transport system substrate-binding protein